LLAIEKSCSHVQVMLQSWPHCIASSELSCVKAAMVHHSRSWHNSCTSDPCCSPSPYHPEY